MFPLEVPQAGDTAKGVRTPGSGEGRSAALLRQAFPRRVSCRTPTRSRATPASFTEGRRTANEGALPCTQFLDPSNEGPRSPAAVSSMRMGLLNFRKRLPEPLGGFFNTMIPPRPASYVRKVRLLITKL